MEEIGFEQESFDDCRDSRSDSGGRVYDDERGSKEGAEVAGKVDLNSLTVEQLLAKAKEEGRVDSVGMPDSWANWVQTWTDLKDKYGIEHTDVDMSSAEELAIFEAEKDNATKDIGDVGQSFGPLAESKGLTLPYKTSHWDEIPAWAKDDDGDWVIGYYGTIAIITNRKLVPNPPKSFADVLEGDYMVTPGNVAQADAGAERSSRRGYS